jgi:hypothetical protein
MPVDHAINQEKTIDTRLKQQLRQWAVYLSGATLLISLLVLIGWQFDLPALRSPFADKVNMNPVSATIMGLAAIAFLFLRTPAEMYTASVQLGRSLAIVIAAFGLWKLLSLFGIIDETPDKLLFTEKVLTEMAAGRTSIIAPNAAFCFVLTGIALFLLPVGTLRSHRIIQAITLLINLVAFFSLVGYLYRVEVFNAILEYIPMSFLSATCFLLLSLACLLANPDKGVMGVITGAYAGSRVARFFIPATIIIPVILGWLRLYGDWKGVFTKEFGATILVMAVITFFLLLIWNAIGLLNKWDAEKESVYKALKRSEDEIIYNASLLQNISDAIVSTDNDFRVVSWNKGAEEMYGWTAAEVIGREFRAIIKPIYEKHNADELRQAYLKSGYWKGEAKHHTKNDTLIDVLVSSSIIRKDDKNTGTVTVIRDITERIRAEQKFRDLLNAAPDATVIVNAGGIIEMINKQVEEVFKYTREELLGKPVEILIPDMLRKGHTEHVKSYIKNPQARAMGAGRELEAQKKDGVMFPVEISLSPLQTDEGLLITASIRDITERRLIEQKLRMFNEHLERQVQERTEQLRQLSAHQLEVREQEQLRISREIHDELGQQLTGLKMDVVWLSKKVPSDNDTIKAKFATLLELLDEMVKTVRRISTGLRPAALDDFGLLPAIEWHGAEFETRFNIPVQLSMPEQSPVIPAEKATAIFRVYQEALTNVARHSGATKVDVRIDCKEDKFVMTIADNGKGFEAGVAGKKKTLGVLGMRERVINIGGQYEIAGSPGSGTTVSVVVPL